MSSPLDNIAVILVEPQGPRNVGSTARAIKNFGLHDLVVVGDLVDLEENECRQMAAGAHDLLEKARRFPDLAAALDDRSYVVGTTARRRHRQITQTARELAPDIVAMAGRERVALLFGREDSGLTADELSLCHHVISVPTSPQRTSINLSQAVLLVAYELFQCSEAEVISADSDPGDLIDKNQWQRLYESMVESSLALGYTHAGNRHAVEQSIQRFLSLGPIQTRDARTLFALNRRIQEHAPSHLRRTKAPDDAPGI